MKEFRVKVDVRNNRLIRYREELGMTAKDFAAAAGISYNLYVSYESMRQHPIGKTGQWRESARRIAEYHGFGFDELWPKVVLDIERVSEERKIGVEEAALWGISDATALAPTVDVAYDRIERKAKIGTVLVSLTSKERQILCRRFGIGNREEESLKGIGVTLGVTSESIRRVEARALRKLRHPSRVKHVKPFVEIGNPVRKSSPVDDAFAYSANAFEEALRTRKRAEKRWRELRDLEKSRREEQAQQAFEERRKLITSYREGLLELGATITEEYLVVWKCTHCSKSTTRTLPWSPAGWVKTVRWKEEKDTRAWCSQACFMATIRSNPR